MAERKPFLLRLDAATMNALRVWAVDDLRSLNGQIEYLLRRALRDAGRLPAPDRARNAPAVSDAEQRGRGALPEVGARDGGRDDVRRTKR